MNNPTMTDIYRTTSPAIPAPYDKWDCKFGPLHALSAEGYTHLLSKFTRQVHEMTLHDKGSTESRLCFKPPVAAPEPNPRKVSVELTLPEGYELDGPDYLRPVTHGSTVYDHARARFINQGRFVDSHLIMQGARMIHLRPIPPPERRLPKLTPLDVAPDWGCVVVARVETIYGETHPLLPPGYDALRMDFTSRHPSSMYLQVTGPNNPPRARPCSKTKTGVVRLILKKQEGAK